MNDALLLTDALRDPASVGSYNDGQWTKVISVARAETLMGTLAARVSAEDIPEAVAAIMAEAQAHADHGHVLAHWEADCARRALAGYDGKVILMKGTAYVEAGHDAGQGRSIGDLDIMVERHDLPQVEALLLDAGWEWVKPDPYDDEYYRKYMHELPPLIHKERDRMIDVHHTTLPLTAKPTPDTTAILDDAVRLDSGQYIMAPADMVLHAVAHLFADGDLAGGLRNLWDIDRMLRQFADAQGFWSELAGRAKLHELRPHMTRAMRLSHNIYDTPIDDGLAGPFGLVDRFYKRRMLARNGWGQQTRKFTRLAFYVRSHWLRMPPFMLARHLWTKWRK